MNAPKWVTLSDRAWFKDEKNGMVCHDWMNCSRDICIFRLKYCKIRHFWYDVNFLYLDIFENGFLYLKDLIEYFKKMYRFYTIGHTVHEINAFEILKKCKKSADSAKNSIFGGTSNAFISWTVCPIELNLYIFLSAQWDLSYEENRFQKYPCRKKWRHIKYGGFLPYFDLKMQISRERFIQSWQTIPFFHP